MHIAADLDSALGRSDLFTRTAEPRMCRNSVSVSFPLQDHLHQAVAGGHVLAGVPGDLAELAGHPRHVPAPRFTPPGAMSGWSHRSPRASSRTRGTSGTLARSGSLRFAPPVSGCHAVNVQLSLWAAGTHRGPKGGLFPPLASVATAPHTAATWPVHRADRPPAQQTGPASGRWSERPAPHVWRRRGCCW
jgi:hypothetical protein